MCGVILPAYSQTTEYSCNFWVKFDLMHSQQLNTSPNNTLMWKYFFPKSDCSSHKIIEPFQEAADLLAHIQSFPITLKDDKRSLVKQGELLGKQVIAKQPRDKNRRKWIRALSLIRKSEALSAQETLSDFEQQGIESVKPICVLEQRKNGMVIDSWLIYEFREGSESNVTKLPEILSLLNQLHLSGYRHDDPNFGNFLVDSNDSLFLIDCKGKKRLGYFSDYYDYMLLSQRNEGVDMDTLIDAVGINTNLWAYKLAQCYAAYKRKRTEFKEKRRQKH